MNGTPMERFWAKVRIDTDGCWVWTAGRSPRGYGRFRWDDGDVRMAHRVAWSSLYGRIPDGLFVCHACDNPPCVRPSHLFVGTNQENTADKVTKGRQSKGSAHGRHKLNEVDAATIYLSVRSGRPQKELAAEYGVSPALISLIANKKKWAWLHGEDAA